MQSINDYLHRSHNAPCLDANMSSVCMRLAQMKNTKGGDHSSFSFGRDVPPQNLKVDPNKIS